MNKLILIAGLPGVGKSTLAKTIAKQENAEIVDIDRFKKKDNNQGQVATQITPPEIRWKYYEEALNYAISLGASTVVMDETFYLQSLRERLENLCSLKGITVQWIEVRCDSTIVERRLLEVRIGHILSPEEAVNMHRLFRQVWEDFPPQKNNHIVVHTDDI